MQILSKTTRQFKKRSKQKQNVATVATNTRQIKNKNMQDKTESNKSIAKKVTSISNNRNTYTKKKHSET